MTRSLFGTDGIRGEANVYPMTVEVALALGRALGHLVNAGLLGRPSAHKRRRIAIGKDTRLSGYCFEQAISAGICSMGVDVILLGPLPTPGIAFVTQSMRADAGVVVSASHNPFYDNGIKIFNYDGFKLPDETEMLLEDLILHPEKLQLRPTGDKIGKTRRVEDAIGRYVVYLKSIFPQALSLENMKIVLDCANGAAYKAAPQILEELGAELICIGDEPNGTNINAACGALYPERVQALVKKEKANLGILLDGDADRVVFVDETGEIVDGDAVLAILADSMCQKAILNPLRLVSTVMSNYSLEKSMQARGILVERVPVGDRYVVECMRKEGIKLGGEQSGHIIMLDHATTGDGMVAALKILQTILESGRPLSALKNILTPSPRVLLSQPVLERIPLMDLPKTQGLIAQIERELKGCGRVLVRHSGTEKKVRILVEADTESIAQDYAGHLAQVMTQEIAALQENTASTFTSTPLAM